MTRSLYNTPDVHINDLLRDAHPAGSANIIDSPSREGVVEDSIEAQMQSLKMVYKQPVAKVIASLAETLETLGATDLSEGVDKLAFDFYHEPLLVKVAGPGGSDKAITAALLMKRILTQYMTVEGPRLMLSVNNTRDRFPSIGSWSEVAGAVKTWTSRQLKSALAELDGVGEYFRDARAQEDTMADSVTTMHFYQKAQEAVQELFSDAGDIKDILKSYEFLRKHIKPIDELLGALDYIMRNPLTAADKYGSSITGSEGDSEHDKTTEDGDLANQSSPGAVINPRGKPDSLMKSMEAVRTRISSLQQEADGLNAMGISEAETDAVLNQYLPAIAKFKKLYNYAAGNKWQVPPNLQDRVISVIDQTNKQLDNLASQLGQLGG
jgi:hypothetical protein